MEFDATLIDLDHQIPKSEKYMYDLVHLSALGSKLLAEKIKPVLDPIVKKIKAAREANY